MLIATFSLPAEAVALETAFESVPEMEVEAERVAATSTEWTMPGLWVTGAPFDAVDEALTADPTVDSVVAGDEFADEKYYFIEWSDAVEDRITTYVDKEGSILSASADAGGWRLKVRFASRAQFGTFREQLTDQGYAFELLDLTEPGAPRQSYGAITPDQRAALIAAAEHGYFCVPRETTSRELADRLDMSHQSLSELLRRGTENLVDAMLSTRGRADDT